MAAILLQMETLQGLLAIAGKHFIAKNELKLLLTLLPALLNILGLVWFGFFQF